MMTKRRGRPPKAQDEKGKAEKVSGWDKLTITIRPSTKRKLDALRVLEGKAGWEILEDALNHYVDRLRPADKELVEGIAARVNKR